MKRILCLTGGAVTAISAVIGIGIGVNAASGAGPVLGMTTYEENPAITCPSEVTYGDNEYDLRPGDQADPRTPVQLVNDEVGPLRAVVPQGTRWTQDHVARALTNERPIALAIPPQSEVDLFDKDHRRIGVFVTTRFDPYGWRITRVYQCAGPPNYKWKPGFTGPSTAEPVPPSD